MAGRWLRRLFKIDEFGLMINRCRDICTMRGRVLFFFFCFRMGNALEEVASANTQPDAFQRFIWSWKGNGQEPV